MINIGRYRVSVYPNSGCIFDIHGGQICFNGNCDIGNASSISIGKNAKVKFGKNFNATAALKLICYNKIEFGDNTLIGWDCLFMDTDFHKIKHLKENDKGHIPYGTIKIGNNCWFALKNIILKNTTLPDNIIVSANSLLNKQYDISPFSLIAGSPAKFIRGDVYRDPEDDVIEYNI